MKKAKVALVHDFLYWRGGAERCLEALRELFPGAPLFTLFWDRARLPEYRGGDVRTSFLDRLPFITRNHYHYLPLYPAAVSSLDFSGFDLIISSSWAWSRNITVPAGALHICYCYTPMRFAAGFFDEYMAGKPAVTKLAFRVMVRRLTSWEKRRGSPQTRYLAISEEVKKRIARHYGSASEVVYPPVDTGFFTPLPGCRREPFSLLVSRLVPYKRVDCAVNAFRLSERRLVIVGEGPESPMLRRNAPPNVEFAGSVSDSELLELYRRGKALVMPQVEDFGLAALEAQACGMPVLAYGKGGALETVIPGITGHFFHEQTPEALGRGLAEMEELHFQTDALRDNALRFSRDLFLERFREKLGSSAGFTCC
ncbi:MAG: glycosyltransferase [Candidatus Eremiobacteraeota bacterium]|nr:glycosyltransferase [Candidatus Eremiobacteraeota bacterium]